MKRIAVIILLGAGYAAYAFGSDPDLAQAILFAMPAFVVNLILATLLHETGHLLPYLRAGAPDVEAVSLFFWSWIRAPGGSWVRRRNPEPGAIGRVLPRCPTNEAEWRRLVAAALLGPVLNALALAALLLSAPDLSLALLDPNRFIESDEMPMFVFALAFVSANALSSLPNFIPWRIGNAPLDAWFARQALRGGEHRAQVAAELTGLAQRLRGDVCT